MTFEANILLGSGGLAILAGLLILFRSPGRFSSVIGGIAMSLLGLLQFGFARGIWTFGWGGRNPWFELSLVFWLAVLLVWVLFAALLSRGGSLARLGGWRFYVLAQAIVCVAALAAVNAVPILDPPVTIRDEMVAPLRPLGRLLLILLQANLVLLTAHFEATYLSLPRQSKHRFGPALIGVVFCTGFYTYLVAASLWHGRISISDLSLGSLPVGLLAILLPPAMIRGRIVERTRPVPGRPLYRTASLALSALTLGTVAGLLALTERTGWSLARAGWTIMIGGVVLGLSAIVVSNRLQRRVWGVIQPYLYRRRIQRPDLWGHLHRELENAHALEDLYEIIPRSVRDIIGLSPVTLFVAEERDPGYVAVSSTLNPLPSATVLREEPLARELRRSHRPLYLSGRPDDLEYIPIYVENGPQLKTCGAVSAVPLWEDEELFGFLLCGGPRRGGGAGFEKLALLEFLAHGYAARLEILLLRSRLGTPGSGGRSRPPGT